jgi:hypothetical protein
MYRLTVNGFMDAGGDGYPHLAGKARLQGRVALEKRSLNSCGGKTWAAIGTRGQDRVQVMKHKKIFRLAASCGRPGAGR